jgi:hypothetical protein
VTAPVFSMINCISRSGCAGASEVLWQNENVRGLVRISAVRETLVVRRVSILLSLSVGLAMLLSCSSSNPNLGRVLFSISVTPATADAKDFPNGQVIFTASGSFSLPPSPAPLTFMPPYAGQFIVANPTNPPATIATVVTTGNSTVTVQCAAGVSGTVPVTASASANNGTDTVITGSAELTCP